MATSQSLPTATTTTTSTPLTLNSSNFTIIHLTRSHPDASNLISAIVHIHAQCILHDHTMATFQPPLSYPQMLTWWHQRVDEVTQDQRQIFLMLKPTAERTVEVGETIFGSASSDRKASNDVNIWSGVPYPTLHATDSSGHSIEVEGAGIVALATPWSETGPFRGIVERFFVSVFHRRRGVGRLLLQELEAVAWRLGRWNLMLDTEVGTDAVGVYDRLGWKRFGFVPSYGISPRVKGCGRHEGREREVLQGKELDGGNAMEWETEEVDEIWYQKDLRQERKSN